MSSSNKIYKMNDNFFSYRLPINIKKQNIALNKENQATRPDNLLHLFKLKLCNGGNVIMFWLTIYYILYNILWLES